MAVFDLDTSYASESWRQQYSTVLWRPVHSEITVSKWDMPSPRQAGVVVSIGEVAGQIADSRLPLADGREIHVREYQHHYTVHWDKVSAVRNPIGHLVSDAPHWIGLGLVIFFIGVLLWAAEGS